MIRQLNSSDMDTSAILKIWLDASLKAHNFIAESYWRSKLDFIQHECLPRAETFVWHTDNEIRGFISIVDSCYIGGLFVAPDFQGKGIGSALLNVVKMKYLQLELKVYKRNQRAVDFYQSQNFVITGEEIDRGTNEAELLMLWKTSAILK